MVHDFLLENFFNVVKNNFLSCSIQKKTSQSLAEIENQNPYGLKSIVLIHSLEANDRLNTKGLEEVDEILCHGRTFLEVKLKV